MAIRRFESRARIAQKKPTLSSSQRGNIYSPSRRSSLSGSQRRRSSLIPLFSKGYPSLIGTDRMATILPSGKGISKKSSTGEIYDGEWRDGMQFGWGVSRIERT